MHLAQISGITSPSTKFTSFSSLLTDAVSRFLVFAIPAAGLYFFIRLIFAGFTLLASLGDAGKIQSAKKQLTNALTGLVVVFGAYFIAQIITTIFGISILTSP